MSPSVAAQLDRAIATGGSIAIPVEEYATRIAPTESAGALLDHLRTEPEGFSRIEAQEFLQSGMEQLRADMEQVIGDQEQETPFRESAAKVKQSLLDEMNTLGRFRPDKNEVDATILSSYFAVRAAQTGMLPEAMYEKFRIRFAAERMDSPGLIVDQGGLALLILQAKAGLGM